MEHIVQGKNEFSVEIWQYRQRKLPLSFLPWPRFQRYVYPPPSRHPTSPVYARIIVIVVIVIIAVMIVVIAVMAGFETDLKSRIMGIRPHLLITQKQGAFTDYNRVLDAIKTIGDIESASAYITTQVVLRTSTRASGAILKGRAACRKVSMKSVTATS